MMCSALRDEFSNRHIHYFCRSWSEVYEHFHWPKSLIATLENGSAGISQSGFSHWHSRLESEEFPAFRMISDSSALIECEIEKHFLPLNPDFDLILFARKVSELARKAINLSSKNEFQLEILELPVRSELAWHYDAPPFDLPDLNDRLSLLATIAGHGGPFWLKPEEYDDIKAKELAIAAYELRTEIESGADCSTPDIVSKRQETVNAIQSLAQNRSIERVKTEDVIIYRENSLFHTSPTSDTKRVIIRLGGLTHSAC